MDRWRDRVAVVTGASSGIGQCTVRYLAAAGMKVAALARRADRLQNLEEELGGSRVKGLVCDVTNLEDIKAAFGWVEDNWGPISVLINNAGVLPFTTLTDEDVYWKIKDVFDINVVALTTCAREAIASMNKHGVTDGVIININSVAGHRLVEADGFAPYCASKHAVTVLSTLLRNELARSGSKIRVTSLSPGLVKTEMSSSLASHYPGPHPTLDTQDLMSAITYCLTVPLHVNISELTMQSVGAQIIKGKMKEDEEKIEKQT